ncbi:MAG: glycosyltransferase family 2 protein [Patescibacteria group bacterium]|nr:glycosyltransferase family 2 protein [Patescibacteria group bacterium]
MYKNKKIAVVVPCYNEAKQITTVIETTPPFVDKIIVIDDKSRDKTVVIVKNLKNKKIILVEHRFNQGVGAAIASGYKWCRDNNIDVAVVMAGDGQMLAKDLPAILEPVVSGKADYSKANRLFSGTAFKKMPKARYFGNSVLTFLTKIASGYWHVVDSQTGFTAINKKMLDLIDWDKMYPRYGQPNDILVRLNVYNAQVADVPVEPVYNVGEKSKLKPMKVFFTIPLMLIRMFFWRLKEKYIIRDFHPLVLFYLFGIFAGLISLVLFVRIIYLWPIYGQIPQTSFLAWMLCVIASLQFTMFAMWFDMDYNKDLKGK